MRSDRLPRQLSLCVLLTAASLGLRAQVPVLTALTIDVVNVVEYQADFAGPLAFAKKPDITPVRGNLAINPSGIGNFFVWTAIGDIVAVNGRDEKEVIVLRERAINTPVASAELYQPGAGGGEVTIGSTRVPLRSSAPVIKAAPAGERGACAH